MEELNPPDPVSSSEQPMMRLNYRASSAILRAIDDEPAHPASSHICIQGYTMLRLLGHGAGGQTWLAERIHTRAPVALKILNPRTADDRSIRRAWRELEILQQLRLPNVPRLLDFGPHESSLYIAAEYIEGVSLDQVFAPTPPETLAQMRPPVELLARLARAVQQLHERGVIHRDLKPSNVMVSADGTPFIIDFGISALQTADQYMTLTAEGVPIGTPAYMPPEQARGERGAMSTRSDLYSLGAIGYWLLTGKTPHDLSGLTLHSAIHRIGWEPPRAPRTIRPDLPPPLAAVLAKACDADPARRYASALELAEDLDAWLDGKPVSAAPPSRWQRTTRWFAHHPIAASAAVSLLIAGAILGSAGITYWELTAHPTSLLHDSSGSFVELVSRSGKRFHRWEAAGSRSLVFQKLVPPPPGMGASDLAVITMAFADDSDPVARVRVFRIDDPGRIVWQTPTSPPEIALPPGTDGWVLDNVPEMYTVRSAEVVEIFSSAPGNEILVCFMHTKKSPTCIRVYSMDGVCLYEAWHNGQLTNAIFMREERLLIARGVTDRPALEDLAVHYPGLVYPVILLALNVPDEPDPPGRSPRLIDSWAQTPTTDVAWTRVFDPVSIGEFTSSFQLRRYGVGRVQLDVGRGYLGADAHDLLHILIATDGSLVDAWPDDRSRRAFGRLVDELRLLSPRDIDAGSVTLRADPVPVEEAGPDDHPEP